MYVCTHTHTQARMKAQPHSSLPVFMRPVWARIFMLDSPPLEPSLICLRALYLAPYSLTHSLPSASPSSSPFPSPSASNLPPISLLTSSFSHLHERSNEGDSRSSHHDPQASGKSPGWGGPVKGCSWRKPQSQGSGRCLWPRGLLQTERMVPTAHSYAHARLWTHTQTSTHTRLFWCRCACVCARCRTHACVDAGYR
jgi:hypothetical protein